MPSPTETTWLTRILTSTTITKPRYAALFGHLPGEERKQELHKALAAVVLSASASVLSAHPLVMNYDVQEIRGGMYHYDIALTLDNLDSSWVPGMGFGWLIWGDASLSASPFADFVMDGGVFPVGPWTGMTFSGGGHNGPTMDFVLDSWVPTSVGETLNWGGTRASYLGQGEFLWSSIFTTGGAPTIEFEVAKMAPEPATIAVLEICVAALLRRRKR